MKHLDQTAAAAMVEWRKDNIDTFITLIGMQGRLIFTKDKMLVLVDKKKCSIDKGPPFFCFFVSHNVDLKK